MRRPGGKRDRGRTPRPERAAFVLGMLLAAAVSSSRAGSQDASKGWPEITPEERGLKSVPQDPEADAVILIATRDGRIVPKGRDMVNVLDYHWRLKVLNERGKRFGEVRIQAGKHSRVEGIEARTVKADGTVVPVPPDQIFEKVVFQSGSYKETAKVFNFPAVEPGVILEYRYTRNDDSLVYIPTWFFAGEEFTRFSRMSQAIPVEAHYKILCDKCPDPEPDRTDWREHKVRGYRFSFQMRDVAGHREEILMPPERDVLPHVEMVLKGWENWYWASIDRDDALFIDWDSVAAYARNHYDGAIASGQSALKSVVAGWIQGVADPQERLQAVFRHIQADFVYDAGMLVYGQTRSVEDILKDRSADNEEKAVLLVAALRAIGVDAHYALVCGRHKGTLYGNYFSLSQFSHVVVAVPRGDGSVQWLDPTVTNAPFDFMPWQDSGAGALLIKEDGAQIVTLPLKPESSGTRFFVTVRPRADGKAILGVEADYRGEDAIAVRDALLSASEADRTKWLQDWLEKARPGSALLTHSIQDLEAIEKPLRVAMSIEAPGLVTKAEGLLLVRGCVLSCYDANPLPRGRRTHPFDVDPDWNKEQVVTVVPPAGVKPAPTPPMTKVRTAIGVVDFSCAPLQDGSIRCTRRLILPRNRLAPDAEEEIRGFFDRLVQVDRTAVAFQEGS